MASSRVPVQPIQKNSTQNVRKLRKTDTDLSQHLQKTNNVQRVISIPGPKLWDQPDQGAKRAPSLATFKRIIKSKL